MNHEETKKQSRSIFAKLPKRERIMDQEFVEVHELKDLKAVREALTELQESGELASLGLTEWGAEDRKIEIRD